MFQKSLNVKMSTILSSLSNLSFVCECLQLFKIKYIFLYYASHLIRPPSCVNSGCDASHKLCHLFKSEGHKTRDPWLTVEAFLQRHAEEFCERRNQKPHWQPSNYAKSFPSYDLVFVGTSFLWKVSSLGGGPSIFQGFRGRAASLNHD